MNRPPIYEIIDRNFPCDKNFQPMTYVLLYIDLRFQFPQEEIKVTIVSLASFVKFQEVQNLFV